jgi:hypothetical protein
LHQQYCITMDPVQLCLDMTPAAPPPPPPPPAPAYTVVLRDSDLGPDERDKAQTRFCRALEERLGAPEELAALLRLLQAAEEEARALTPHEQTLALRWQRAQAAARITGLQELAQTTEAWFEIVV